jgi:hypothetical protein
MVFFFSIIVLTTIYGLFGFILYQKYFLNLGAIFSNYPKFKLKLVSKICLLISWNISFIDINLLWGTTNF